MKGRQLIELLQPFTVVKDRYLCNKLALRVAQATKTCGSHRSIHYHATIFQPPRDGLILERGYVGIACATGRRRMVEGCFPLSSSFCFVLSTYYLPPTLQPLHPLFHS
jgi:hypothetical protein